MDGKSMRFIKSIHLFPTLFVCALLLSGAGPFLWADATLSGTILDLNGLPIQDVQLNITGSSTSLTATNAAGAYSFPNLVVGNSYTVTPSSTAGYVFSPLARSTTSLSSDPINQDFLYGKRWSGGGLDSLASSTANWAGGVAPQNGDAVQFDVAPSTKNCVWDLAGEIKYFQMTTNFSTSVVVMATAGASVDLGTVVIAGGEFDMGAYNINISSAFVQTGGKFHAAKDGFVYFDGTQSQTVSMVKNKVGSAYDSYFFNLWAQNTVSVQALSDLVKKRLATKENALLKSSDPVSLDRLLGGTVKSIPDFR